MKSKISKIALIIAAGVFTLSGLFAATKMENVQQHGPKFKDINVMNNSSFKVKLTFFEVDNDKKDITVNAEDRKSKSLGWFTGKELASIKAVVVVDGNDTAPITSNILWNGSEAKLSESPLNAKISLKATASSKDGDDILDVTIDNATASKRPVDTKL